MCQRCCLHCTLKKTMEYEQRKKIQSRGSLVSQPWCIGPALEFRRHIPPGPLGNIGPSSAPFSRESRCSHITFSPSAVLCRTQRWPLGLVAWRGGPAGPATALNSPGPGLSALTTAAADNTQKARPRVGERTAASLRIIQCQDELWLTQLSTHRKGMAPVMVMHIR